MGHFVLGKLKFWSSKKQRTRKQKFSLALGHVHEKKKIKFSNIKKNRKRKRIKIIKDWRVLGFFLLIKIMIGFLAISFLDSSNCSQIN